jgi:pilus assembly protein Flp/PilA
MSAIFNSLIQAPRGLSTSRLAFKAGYQEVFMNLKVIPQNQQNKKATGFPPHHQRGQGLVEYILIVALIAAGSIMAVQFLGQNIRYKLTQISGSLGANMRGISAPQKPQGLTERKDINQVFQD